MLADIEQREKQRSGDRGGGRRGDATRQRRGSNVVQEIIESAYRYGMVAFRTDHVGYNQQSMRDTTGKQARYRRQSSPFLWTVYNPRNVFPTY